MNNAFCLSARDVRMISAPGKLKSVMYELTTSVTNLPETSHILSLVLARSRSEVLEMGLFVSAGCLSVCNNWSAGKLTYIK